MAFLNSIQEVPPVGPLDANIMLIGEAPSVKELQKGEPFVGPDGGVLDSCLAHAELDRGDIRIVNLFPFKIYKPKGKQTIYHPQTKEILFHPSKGLQGEGLLLAERLYDEINRVNPNLLVPLGGPALFAITQKFGIHKWRGSILESAFCSENEHKVYKVIPTIHPGAVIQGSPLDKYKIAHDFREKVKPEQHYPQIIPLNQQFYAVPTFEESIKLLREYKERAKQGYRINYDIEIMNSQLDCISFATNMYEACSINLRWKDAEKDLAIRQELAELIEMPNASFCNENILFDITTLGFKDQIIHKMTTQRIDDPMTANHIIYPDFPKSLKFLTSLYTPIPYYKDDGKVYTLKQTDKMGGIEKRRRYNCQDSTASIECMNQLDRELDTLGYRQQYEDTIRLYPALAAMMLRGVLVDEDNLKEAQVQIQSEYDQKIEELDQMIGFHINPHSSQQCNNYFYTLQGIKPFLNKDGNPTTDEKSLAALARGTKTRKPFPEASKIIQIRKLGKLLSTYFSIQFDEDHRFRCSYNPRGTTTGRLSSSQTIFGTGMNMQNVPESFRQFIVADPGYVLVEIDKAGAEWFVVAYLANDPRMIEIHQKGLDSHGITAELITGVPLELIKKENKICKHDTDPDTLYEKRKEHIPEIFKEAKYLPRTMACRQAGKKSNHGFNYGQRPDRFSKDNEIPLAESKVIFNGYHEAYPNISNIFWRYVEKRMKTDRTLENLFGHKRRFLQPGGYKLNLSAYDYIPQSTVGWIINYGLIHTYESQAPELKRCELLANVHDSFMVQLPLSDGYDSISRGIELLCQYVDPTLEFQGQKFNIGTDIKIGFNWRDMEEVSREENSPARIKDVLSSLEQ
jgi:uracil-DNA glycosylase family 4